MVGRGRGRDGLQLLIGEQRVLVVVVEMEIDGWGGRDVVEAMVVGRGSRGHLFRGRVRLLERKVRALVTSLLSLVHRMQNRAST
jgi:hypothetical protein